MIPNALLYPGPLIVFDPKGEGGRSFRARRLNYLHDPLCAGLFDPHPGRPFFQGRFRVKNARTPRGAGEGGISRASVARAPARIPQDDRNTSIASYW